MSSVTVRRYPAPRDRDKKKMLQSCEIGGIRSMYGRTPGSGGIKIDNTVKQQKDISSNYNNFYQNQVNLMNKVFGRKREQG
ncbi:MAG: hypothetical protein WCV56_03030 [Candidatus Omnitrophota bacterium]